MMIGTFAVSGARRSRRHTSIPDSPSTIQSSMTISGGVSRANSSASSPSGYAGRGNPRARNGRSAVRRARRRPRPAAFGRRSCVGLLLQRHGGAAAALALGHALAGGGVMDHLGDVGGMVADPFEVLGDEQTMRDLADALGVLHHEGDEHADDSIVEIVDLDRKGV